MAWWNIINNEDYFYKSTVFRKSNPCFFGIGGNSDSVKTFSRETIVKINTLCISISSNVFLIYVHHLDTISETQTVVKDLSLSLLSTLFSSLSVPMIVVAIFHLHVDIFRLTTVLQEVFTSMKKFICNIHNKYFNFRRIFIPHWSGSSGPKIGIFPNQ